MPPDAAIFVCVQSNAGTGSNSGASSWGSGASSWGSGAMVQSLASNNGKSAFQGPPVPRSFQTHLHGGFDMAQWLGLGA